MCSRGGTITNTAAAARFPDLTYGNGVPTKVSGGLVVLGVGVDGSMTSQAQGIAATAGISAEKASSV